MFKKGQDVWVRGILVRKCPSGGPGDWDVDVPVATPYLQIHEAYLAPRQPSPVTVKCDLGCEHNWADLPFHMRRALLQKHLPVRGLIPELAYCRNLRTALKRENLTFERFMEGIE